MAIRFSAMLGATALVIAAATPAMAADSGSTAPKPVHKVVVHHHHHGVKHSGGAAAQDSAVDRLNAQSLSAARSGTAPAVTDGNTAAPATAPATDTTK